MPQIPDFLPPDTASPVNHPSDTVFEVDPNTRTRLITAPVAEDPHNAVLSALVDSVPDDHAPEVLLTYASHTDNALIPEQGPDLISGVVTIDDVTFTTLPSLTSGASTTSPFRCRALLDTGSPQSFIHQGAFDQMVATGAANESYVRSTTTQIVEWLRLPRAAQLKPKNPDDHPVLSQRYTLRVTCGMDVNRPE